MDDDAGRLELSPSLRQLGHPNLDPSLDVSERWLGDTEAARNGRESALAGSGNSAHSAELQPLVQEALADSKEKPGTAKSEVELLQRTADELQWQNKALISSVAEEQRIAERLRSESQFLREQNRALRLEIDRLQAIEASTMWRATARLRAVADRLPQTVRLYLRRAVKAGYWALTPHKMPERLKFLRDRRRGEDTSGTIITFESDTAEDYADWIGCYDTLNDDDRRAIGEAIGRLVDPPLISVVMPVYEAPERDLRAAVDSVRAQLYPNWELCIADDASKSRHIRKVIEAYRAVDTRIKVCYRSEPGQISEAGNSALALAEGQFIALLDQGDQLPEHALYMVAAALAETPELDLIFSDEDKLDPRGARFDPHFKSDWNPDLMLSQNTFSHLGIYRRSLVEAVGGFRAGYEGSQDYDLVMRASARTKPERIHHIPHILYHARAVSGLSMVPGEKETHSVEKPRQVVADYLKENDIAASVVVSGAPGGYRVQYRVPDPAPLVSLIVPTTGKLDILRTCITGILDQTDYAPIELIIVPNNTGERQEVFQYLEELSRARHVRIVPDSRTGFSFSRVANIGMAQATGELIGLINDDLEVIDPGWLGEMVSHAIRPGIGAVGAMLYYPSGHIQHGGVIVGLGGVAGHAHLHRPRGELGYFGRAATLQNVSAVTAACLVMPKAVYREVGPLDEENLAVAYNDIDLCLRIREKGYRIVWTPHAELYHHESLTRGSDLDPENLERFNWEIYQMKRRWGAILERDPYYNPNLSLRLPDFNLAFPPRVTKPWR